MPTPTCSTLQFRGPAVEYSAISSSEVELLVSDASSSELSSSPSESSTSSWHSRRLVEHIAPLQDAQTAQACRTGAVLQYPKQSLYHVGSTQVGRCCADPLTWEAASCISSSGCSAPAAALSSSICSSSSSSSGKPPSPRAFRRTGQTGSVLPAAAPAAICRSSIFGRSISSSGIGARTERACRNRDALWLISSSELAEKTLVSGSLWCLGTSGRQFLLGASAAAVASDACRCHQKHMLLPPPCRCRSNVSP